MNNPELDLSNLAELLYRLSKTKSEAIFRQFVVNKKPITQNKGPNLEARRKMRRSSPPVCKLTITDYLIESIEGDRILVLLGHLGKSQPEICSFLSRNNLVMNPFFFCYLETEKYCLKAHAFIPYINFQDWLDEANYRLNSSLIYLYQKIRHDSIKQKAIQFYKTVDSRNKSIRRLVNYSSDKKILFFQVSATLNFSDDFSQYFNEMSLCRKGIITHLRNHFKDRNVLKNCKYIWRVNVDHCGRLFFIMTIMADVEQSIFSEFCDDWTKKLNKYISKNKWENLDLVIDGVNSITKADLINKLLERPVVIMTDPEEHKKSVFGLGGLGGRKYK